MRNMRDIKRLLASERLETFLASKKAVPITRKLRPAEGTMALIPLEEAQLPPKQAPSMKPMAGKK